MKSIVVLALCLFVGFFPAVASAAGAEARDSASWTNTVLEENSLTASLLYIPYTILRVPVAVINGIVNPKPTSQATSPPAAHRVHR